MSIAPSDLADRIAALSDEARAALGALFPAPNGPPLTLTPDPAPSQGDHEVSGAQLRAWEAIYKTKHRQLRRWIARGLARGEPCPLDNPALMPAWIEKHLEKIRGDLRDNVQAAAEKAAPQARAPIPGPSASAAAAQPPSASLPQQSASIDLATVGGVEGESVALFRQLFAAAKIELIDAYRGGSEDRKRTLHTRIEKIGESLRKHEAAAEMKAKRQGDLLEKAEVLNEVTQALNVMARIEEQRADLVAADVPELPPELARKVRDSFLRSGEKARAMLRNLSVLRTTSDVQLELAA